MYVHMYMPIAICYIVTLWNNIVGGELCIDSVDIYQHPNGQVGENKLVIVPDFNFSCNGRITSIRAKVKKTSNSMKFPCFQVWRPSPTDPSIYNKIGEVNMSSTDQVTRNITTINLIDDNIIEFQSGDVIGYYHPPNTHYVVTHIKNKINGYKLHHINQSWNSTVVNITDARLTNKARPLLQFTTGMTLT